MNKKKIVCASVVIIAVLVGIILLSQNNAEYNQPETNTVGNEIHHGTQNTEAMEKTEKAEPEVQILESTPDSVTMLVPGGTGEEIQVQIGVDKDEQIADAESDGTSPTLPTNTKPPVEEETVETTVPPEATQGTPTEPKIENKYTDGPDWNTTLAEYEAMSAQEQLLFYYSFANAEEFQTWYNAAKAEHDANSGDIIIGGDGVVNAGGK